MNRASVHQFVYERLPVWARRTAISLLILLACVVCFYRIGARSMWLDELSHRDIGMMSVAQLMNDPTLSVQPSHGYYLIHRFSEWVCGDMDVGNRLPEALCAIMSVLLTYLIGRHLFSTGAGLLAAASLLANSFYVRYAQENRFYQMGSFGYLLVFYTLVRFLEKQTWKQGLWFVLAASFALRTHSYGMVTVTAAGIVCAILTGWSYMLPRATPYHVRGAMIGKLALAALCIVILWMPYPLRIGQFLSASKHAPAFDGFWTAPFSLSPVAVIGYMCDNFVIVDPLLKPWYLLPMGAALAGTLFYRRGRFIVLIVFFFAATLPVIYAMNNARAAVMPKRFVYFLPMLTIWVAGGLSMIAAAAGSMIGALIRLFKRWIPARGITICSTAAIAIMWLWLLGIYVVPVIARGAYDVSQWYYGEWHVIYREVATMLTLHARPGERVWWYPPVNDGWLCERYLPRSAGVALELKYAHQITRAALLQSLTNAPGIWVYGVDLRHLGFEPQSYVGVRAGKNTLFLVRPEYLHTNVQHDSDAELLYRSMLNISRYPEIECTDDLVHLLLRRGRNDLADTVVERLHHYPRSLDAVTYAVNYWTNHSAYARAYELQCAFADRHFWMGSAQIDAARAALLAQRPADAVRYARRVVPSSPHLRALRHELCGEAFQALARFDDAASHYAGAMRIRRALSSTPPHHLLALSRARQECLLKTGDGAGVLLAWLDGWTLSPDLARMFAFTNLLETVCAPSNHLHVRTPHQFLPVFLQWYCLRPWTNDIPAPLVRQARSTVRARTWPLYAYFLDHIPSNAVAAALVPPEELTKRGFNFYAFWDNALIWFESFYMRHGGLEMAVRYWDAVNASRSNITDVAAINQAKLAYQCGNFDLCTDSLQKYHEYVHATGWTRERAIGMLVHITNSYPRARSVLQRYESSLTQ